MVGGRSFLGLEEERREVGEGWEAGACHRKAEMQVRASARPSPSGRFEGPSQAGKKEASPAPPLPG